VRISDFIEYATNSNNWETIMIGIGVSELLLLLLMLGAGIFVAGGIAAIVYFASRK